MLVNADVKGLEIVVAAELSGDATLKQELIDKVDIHDANRVRFGLGEGKPGRLVAKVLAFRTIYGGSAFSFASDPAFTGVSSSVKYWEKVLDEFYTKYKGLKQWHIDIVNAVKRDGYLYIPSGRYYPFQATFNGTEWRWPVTQIKNYPVQGFGADLVMLARVEAYRKLRASGLEFAMVCTIHDSIIVDCPKEVVYNVGIILRDAILAVPRLCQETFGYAFSLPLTSEISVGPNKQSLKEILLEENTWAFK